MIDWNRTNMIGNKTEQIINKSVESEAEHCVLCDSETKYKKRDQIIERKQYIKGGGQLLMSVILNYTAQITHKTYIYARV